MIIIIPIFLDRRSLAWLYLKSDEYWGCQINSEVQKPVAHRPARKEDYRYAKHDTTPSNTLYLKNTFRKN
jgi:hypothetical protein